MIPEMDLTVGIVAIVILILVIALFRRNPATTDERRPPPLRPGNARPDSRFHAVSISFAGSACEAAKAMEGKRFLSSAAPRVPLPDCDVLQCKCRFIHHKDRRDGDERRNSNGQSFGGDTGEQIK